MVDPISATFAQLSATVNPNAVEVLLHALTVPNVRVREQAIDVVIRRNHARGQNEIIRQWRELSADARENVVRNLPRFESTLRHCLHAGRGDIRRNALEIVRDYNQFRALPALIDVLRDNSGDHLRSCIDTLHYLVGRLYDFCNQRRNSLETDNPHPANYGQVRHELLMVLEKAVESIQNFALPEEVIASIYSLGSPEHGAVKKVLNHPVPEVHQLAVQVLHEGTHPGLMQLPLDWMGKPYPHQCVYECISKRSDPQFINHMLSWFPERLSASQVRNFEQITSLAWIDESLSQIDLVLPRCQAALAGFVSSVALPREVKLAVHEWLVRNGDSQGRIAAAHVLRSLEPEAVEQIVCESLDSEDAEVQAWATGQLREQDVPGALDMLIRRLDSPLDEVRSAAREELKSFDFKRMLEIYPKLPTETCRRAAQLILKINPDSILQLQRELASPIRTRRLEAAKAIKVMDLQAMLVPALTALLHDSDALVRRMAVEILATVPATQARFAIRELVDDPSPRVRKAVEDALKTTATK